MTDLSWIERFGIQGNDLPSIAGTCSGSVLVAGSGRCLWDDLRIAGKCDDIPVICVKDAGLYWPRQVDHWYSSHLDQLLLQRQMRACRSRYANLDAKRPTSHSIYSGSDFTWPWPGHSSSGLMAVYTAFGLGFDHVIVVGMPQDSGGHFYDPPVGHPMFQHPNNFAKRKNEKLWKLAEQHIFKGRVRMISGNAKRWIEEARKSPAEAGLQV